MKRILILVVTLPLLALGAGVVAGMLASRLPAEPAIDDAGMPLADLHLTTDQRDQMRVIWENVQRRIQRDYESATRLQKDRDDAILALLNDAQKAEFAKISQTYSDHYKELNTAREKAFSDAVDETKKLLDENQRKQYEEILKTRVVRPGGILNSGSQI